MPHFYRKAIILMTRMLLLLAIFTFPFLAKAGHEPSPISDIDHTGIGSFSGYYTHSTTDHPWFVFNANSGDKISIYIHTYFSAGSYAWLYRASDNCAEIGDSRTNGSLTLVATYYNNGVLTYTVPAAGQYALQLDSYIGGSGKYNVSISGATAFTALCSPKAPLEAKVYGYDFCGGSSNLGAIKVFGSGGLSPYTYSIDGGVTYQTDYKFEKLPAGTYQVKLKDSKGATTENQQVIITQMPPVLVKVSASGPTTICPRGSVTLTASGADLYRWSNGATTPSITVTAGGTYSVYGIVNHKDKSMSCSSPVVSTTVKVEDTEAPVAKARDLTVTLKNGWATITSNQINDGSTDNCGIGAMLLSKYRFSCADIGPNTITLRVIDRGNNSSTATAVVTVVGEVPAPSIAVTKENNTFTGAGTEKTVFLGYGAQSVTLNAANPTPATFAWAPAEGLSHVDSPSPVFTPTQAGTYTFTVEATNEYGCKEKAQVTVEVVDVRCGDKVLVCHKGQKICIDANAVAAHLAHGCSLGACTPVKKQRTAVAISPLEKVTTTGLSTYPNPVSGKATVAFTSTQAGAYTLQVYDLKGTLVKVIANGNTDADESFSYELNAANLPKGVYLVKLATADKVETSRIVVQ